MSNSDLSQPTLSGRQALVAVVGRRTTGCIASAATASGAAVGLAAVYPTASGPLLGVFALFGAVLGLVAVVDACTRIIPNVLIYPAAAVGLVLGVGATVGGPEGSPLGAFACAAVTLAAGHALWRRSPASIGYGDVRLCTYVAAHVGFVSWQLLPTALAAGFGLAALAGATKALVPPGLGGTSSGLGSGVGSGVGRDRGNGVVQRLRRQRLALGPYLAVGALAVLVWANTASVPSPT